MRTQTHRIHERASVEPTVELTVAPDRRHSPSTSRPARVRDARRPRRRSDRRSILGRTRGIPSTEAGAPQGIDRRKTPRWTTLPVALLLDTDFDGEDEWVLVGPAHRLCRAVSDEERDVA